MFYAEGAEGEASTAAPDAKGAKGEDAAADEEEKAAKRRMR